LADPADLEAALRRRRSVRSFEPHPVPEAVLERLIEAAILAPSASNKQPWRFFIVVDRGAIHRMADAVREAVVDVKNHIPPESQAAFAAYGEYFTRFERAPAVIVPICRGHRVLSHLVGPDLPQPQRDRILEMERDSGLTGTALALMNLLLVASELGLGASAMTGPLLAADRLREILEIPKSWGIVALVPVGYPAEAPVPTDRKTIDKVVRWIR
jgi:nitroreductase